MEVIAERVKGLLPFIEPAAKRHGLTPGLLAGLVCQESAGDTWATRPEPLYKWLFGDSPQELNRLKLPKVRRLVKLDLYEQRISYGLCQVMGAVAREHGWGGWLTELCQPEIGLEYGARHLAWCVKKAGGDVASGLLKYNGGGDKSYPQKVLNWAENFQ